MTTSITLFNGRPAQAADLAPLAFTGFAHFTAMQVHDRRVRGLDLYLNRMRKASDELFGRHLPDETILQQMRSALAGASQNASLTCFTSSRPGEFARAAGDIELDVLIKITMPAEPPTGPLSLSTSSSTSGISPA